MRQIVLDTETTGLSVQEGHKIIEIGGIELVARRFTGKHFHCYLNPQREIEAGALQVHGITKEFLADKPLFEQIADEFLAFIKDAELIIHNAQFDIGFLDHELSLAGKKQPSLSELNPVIDTLTLAREKHPGNNKLDALCKRYGIDNSKRTLHGALLDARLLAEVYLAMTSGQVNLFSGFSPNTHAESLQVNQMELPEKLNKIPVSQTLVIMANDEEEQAHQQRLSTILQTGGKCLWLSERD